LKFCLVLFRFFCFVLFCFFFGLFWENRRERVETKSKRAKAGNAVEKRRCDSTVLRMAVFLLFLMKHNLASAACGRCRAGQRSTCVEGNQSQRMRIDLLPIQ